MDRFDMLFGPKCREAGFDYVCGQEQMEALREMEQAVACELFGEIKVKLPGGDMAVIKSIGNDTQVSREMKRKKTV